MPDRIKTVLLEEHHEAFPTWMRAHDLGWVDETPLKLLHIDDHADWDFPRLSKPLPPLGTSLKDLRRFTYDQLNIGNFIWPAVYRRLLDGVYWHRASFTKDQPRDRMFIVAVEEREREFITGRVPNETQQSVSIGVGPPRFVHYQRIPDRAEIPGDGPVAISLCLDYFSGHAYPVAQEGRLEVTEETFRNFERERYHFLRLAPGALVTAHEKGGRFWLLFNDYGYPEWPRLLSNGEEIARRIRRVRGLIERHADRLSLVTVSRSVKSGYTPPAQANHIEAAVLDMLADVIPTEVLSFDDIP